MHQREPRKPTGVEPSSRRKSCIDALQGLGLFLARATMSSHEEGKATRRLAMAIVALSPLLLADLSYAAGRVFYDGFETGNTNLWVVASDGRNGCQVVTSAVDRVVGPYAGSRMVSCNWNGTVEWNAPEAFESLLLRLSSVGSYNKEFFLRVRLRADQNLDRTGGASAKILRFFESNLNFGNNVDECNGINSGWGNSSYWGCADGDNSATPGSWHKIEIYFNETTGNIKQWNDGMLVMNGIASFQGYKWTNLFIVSNFSNPHDATNNIYYDEFEIFTDKASGASGSMSDASISASASPPPLPPTDVAVR